MNRSTLLLVPLSFVWGACGGDRAEALDDSTPGAEFADAPGIDTEAAFELAQVSQALAPGEIFAFENRKTANGTKMCIGVDRASTDVGARIKLFACDGSTNQRWEATAVTVSGFSGWENVKARGKCMGVDGGSTAAGADIALFNCDSAPNQTWSLQGSELPFFNFVNSRPEPSRCIGIDGGQAVVGAQLKQFECNFGAPNQNWRPH
jgi:hypothetical protein